MDDADVPPDFPQEVLGAVPGAQPKLLVHRTADGRYVDTAASLRAERWAICQDLCEQLVDYVNKHLPPGESAAAYASTLGVAIERKRKSWGMSEAEIAWVRRELVRRFADQ
jgi:hypothetical protein